MKIALFGCNGQVGWELQRALASFGPLTPIDSTTAPLADPATVDTVLQRVLDAALPDLIVNAAAYTAVDQAETDRAAAWSVNARAPAAMARWAKANGALLIHYSTDYVFDGSGTHFRSETESAAPLNAYGQSKFDGEQAIAETGCAHWIFRTSWVFGHRGGNFARTILTRAQTQAELKVVNDQFGAPTSAWLIADATARALQTAVLAEFDQKSATGRREKDLFSYISNSKLHQTNGIYHLVASGECTWFDYAQALIDCGRVQCPDRHWARVTPVGSEHDPTPAKRPANSRLSTQKGCAAFGWHLPNWRSDVQRWVALQAVPSALQTPPNL